MPITTYAWSCCDRLYIDEGPLRNTDPREAEHWQLIAAWPGTIKDMPDSLRPALQKMYEHPSSSPSR